MTELAEIKKEVAARLADKDTLNTLIATTFKGLNANVVPRAIMEGMMRGFSFKDFLEKNIYAIPFKDGYSLVTSIDYARKTGMRSGIIGKTAPHFVEADGKIVSCEVTVKRLVEGVTGEYSALVFFNEYNTGRNLWATKPHTMIAKVAEMHALRMACPEELSQSYIEEEVQQTPIEAEAIDVTDYKTKLEATTNLDELKAVWSSLPGEAKKVLGELKDQLKTKYESH